MKTTLSSWMHKWLHISARNRRRVKRTAACLAVSLATAWVDSAEAAVVHLEVTPSQTVTNAWAGYLTTNSSSPYWFSLGTLPAGQTSEFNTDYPGYTEDYFIPGGYAIVGVYQHGDIHGITASSPDDSPIVNGATWESTLGQYFGFNSEQSVADVLASGSFFWVSNFYSFYTEVPFGTQAVLVNCSEAAPAGTALATVVPEPATWMLLVTGAGLSLGCARRRRG